MFGGAYGCFRLVVGSGFAYLVWFVMVFVYVDIFDSMFLGYYFGLYMVWVGVVCLLDSMCFILVWCELRGFVI